MLRLLLPLVLGLSHGVADGSVGMQLGLLPGRMPLAEVGLLVLAYNVLAFGSQPFLGLVVDRYGRPREAVLGGLLLHVAALLLSHEMPVPAVALAGIGSALFHIGGGALALCATQGQAVGPGLFAAPGVVGLAIGGGLAVAGYRFWEPFLLLLLVSVVVVAAVHLPPLPYSPFHKEPILERHDFVMLVLLAAIALRSAVWTTYQYLLDGRVEMLLLIAAAAALGKLLGGVLADRVGWRDYSLGALLLAAPLLSFGGNNLLTLLPGIALLQSVTPVALGAAGHLLPHKPATASGLVLGLAIAVGGLPGLAQLSPHMASPPVLTLLVLGGALTLWYVLGKRSMPELLTPQWIKAIPRHHKVSTEAEVM